MSDELKLQRQTALKSLISKQRLKTQSDLVSALKKMGFSVGQATVSRDIQDLRVVRSGGIYRLAGDGPSQKGWERLLKHPNLKIAKAGDALIVVTIGLGQAPFLAAELDKENWPEIVGTIAGDDTLFIAVNSKAHQTEVILRLETSV